MCRSIHFTCATNQVILPTMCKFLLNGITLEPDAQNFSLLKENLKPYKNIRMLKKVLWAVSNMQMQRITKKFHDGLQWSYQFEPHPQGAIESISLNKIAQQL